LSLPANTPGGAGENGLNGLMRANVHLTYRAYLGTPLLA
jgi:hypothetical protein